jgi:hypothetical protein
MPSSPSSARIWRRLSPSVASASHGQRHVDVQRGVHDVLAVRRREELPDAAVQPTPQPVGNVSACRAAPSCRVPRVVAG